jgi:hypothetical protein
MPRYFFRLQDGGVFDDREGEQLADDAAARRAALEIFCETLETKAEHIGEGGAYEVLVRREDDRPFFSVTAQGRRLAEGDDDG